MSEATSIATIFEDFGIDHTPDGWPPVKQMHLTAAAAELRRLQASEDELMKALGECRDAMPPTATDIGEAIGFPTSVPAYVRQSVSLLTAQKDGLLTALEEVSEVFDKEWRVGSTQRRLGDMARAAIAKATEGGAT